MKLTMLFAAAGLSAVVISGRVFAQDTKIQADLAGTPSKMQARSAGLSDASSASAAAASTINLHAIKDFKVRFGNVKDERWYVIDKGFLAYFSLDGCRERAYYDRKGHWEASLIYGDEHKLPADIRELVRRAYYDLPITCVTVIEVPGHVVYQVLVEDQTKMKILRITEDGEMDVTSELTKQ
ncbi:MAG TPA: hypothetical protein VNU70_05750 [Puia sp.]|nr:hypothetical protein [Puia sp.]